MIHINIANTIRECTVPLYHTCEAYFKSNVTISIWLHCSRRRKKEGRPLCTDFCVFQPKFQKLMNGSKTLEFCSTVCITNETINHQSYYASLHCHLLLFQQQRISDMLLRSDVSDHCTTRVEVFDL